MTTSLRIGEDLRGSATRSLRASGSRQRGGRGNVQLPYGVKLVSGNSWYHEEAIQSASDSEQGREASSPRYSVRWKFPGPICGAAARRGSGCRQPR